MVKGNVGNKKSFKKFSFYFFYNEDVFFFIN